jgi:hypothetical protein
LIKKKFKSLVFPGVELILAKFLLLVIVFKREDLPTFDLPANAIWGRLFFGTVLKSAKLLK